LLSSSHGAVIHLSRGYAFAILAAGLAALMHVMPKPLLESNSGFLEVHPITLACAIYLINGLFFSPFSKNAEPYYKIGRKTALFITLIGLAEVLGLITYFFGLRESTATNAAILNNSEIVFSIIIAITILRERLHKRELVPFSIVIVGIAVLPIGFDFYQRGMAITGLVSGDFLILLSGLFFALDINISKYVSDRIDSKRIAQLTSFSAGGFALGLIVFFQIPFDISLSHVPGILITGIAGTGISTLFFIIALRMIGAVRTTVAYSTSSIFGVILAGVFLNESITIVNIISLIMVLGGTYFLKNKISGEEGSEVKSRWNLGNL
jgi:drug/metabolite transporter (DMT)-like permease